MTIDLGRTIPAISGGEGHKTECLLFVYKEWFCIQGEEYAHQTYEELHPGVDIETVEDVDVFYISNGINSLNQLVRLVDSRPEDKGREVVGTYGSYRTPGDILTYRGWYCVKGSANVTRTNQCVEDGIHVETLNNIGFFWHRDGVNSLEQLVEIIKMREANSD
jgi:hypothetical protein